MMNRPTPDAEMNLRFAWAVLMLGMNQHDVASLFGVNGGRVAEAVSAVRLAISHPVRFVETPINVTVDELQKLLDEPDPDVNVLADGTTVPTGGST